MLQFRHICVLTHERENHESTADADWSNMLAGPLGYRPVASSVSNYAGESNVLLASRQNDLGLTGRHAESHGKDEQVVNYQLQCWFICVSDHNAERTMRAPSKNPSAASTRGDVTTLPLSA